MKPPRSLSAYSVTSTDVIHCGDALAVLRTLPDQFVQKVVLPTVLWYNLLSHNTEEFMRDEYGRFKRGSRNSPDTEFKPGEHWREKQPYWDRNWLYREYVEKQRSSGEIAEQFGVKDANILYFLRKFGIPRRNVSGARAVKYWAQRGEDNPMYGRTGEDNPSWRGGVTPERQTLYSSREWAKAVTAVWKRNQGVCQRCGATWRENPNMHIHHIVSFSVEELRTEVSNLVLLCRECHHWVHSKENIDNDFIADAP